MSRPTVPAILSYALYGGMAALFCAPLFESPHGLGASYDWDQHLFYYGPVLKSVVEYGVPPFWNPWYCGGNVLWQNPQIALLSPAYPLAMLTSLALAMKINILLHYGIGFIGMHLVLRRALGIASRAVVAYLACVFTLSGAHVLHLAVGHSNFLPAFYLPLQAFFFLRAVQTGMARHVLAAGGLLALMVYNGGLHIVTMSVASVAFFALLASLLWRRWRPVVLAAVMVAAGLAYAAPKFLPVTLFVTGDRFFDARNPIEHPDRMSADMLLHAYVDRYQYFASQVDEEQQGWHEYGNYTGAFFALLLASSIIWIVAYRGTHERWLGLSLGGTSLFLLALSAGDFGALAPASLATHLPFFSSFRVPSRYTIPFVLFGVLTVAWVWRQIETDQLNRRVRSFVVVVCVLAAGDLLIGNRTQFNNVFSEPPLQQTFRPLGGPNAIAIDRDSSPYDPPMFRGLMNDLPSYDCYEPLQLVRTADADHPLIFTDGRSTIFETVFSPNRIEFTVLGGTEPSSVFLNENYAAGWRSTLAPVTLDAEYDKPAATIEAGQGGRFNFSFVPDGLGIGVMLLMVTVVGSVWAWKRRVPI